MIKFLDIIKEGNKKDNFTYDDRLKMYVKYFKNVSPKNFKVKLKKDEIVITIPK